MFDDLYDSLSLLWSSRWPEAIGEITAIDIERIEHTRGRDTLRLAIAYKFSVGDDGPYTGEAFWEPSFFSNRRVPEARHKVHMHQQVLVHYRPDDPSVNKLDSRIFRDF